MKKIIASIAFAAFIFTSCEKNETSNPSNISPEDNMAVSKTENATAANCEVFSLVLSGSTGTPHIGGLGSFIVRTDVCSGMALSSVQIKLGGNPVTSVTGLSKSHLAGEFYAVTGANSNFPRRIMRVNMLGNVVGMINAWFGSPNQLVPLQDIEWRGVGADYYAIKEGSNTIFKVNVATGQCTVYAAPPTNQLNGLTFDSAGRMWVISGTTNAVCAPKTGDMWSYAGIMVGALMATRTYNNLPANSNWTMKELGLNFDTCCGKRWIVGSSSGVYSNNGTITCTGPNPTFIANIKPTYDYARR